jgi:hypothetical protein
MVRQDMTRKKHNEIMAELEEKLAGLLNIKKYQQCLSLGDILTVWQRVMSKFRNGDR